MDISDDILYEEEDSNEFLGSAVVKKIEKAKLYQMLLTCDFFDEDVADEDIVLEVTKEVRRFVHYKLEHLLGARQEDSAFGESSPQESLPWNKSQIEALTVLANNILNRNSKNQIEESPSVKRIKKRPIEVKKAAHKTVTATKTATKTVAASRKKEDEESVTTASSRHRLVNNPDRIPMPSQMQIDTINANLAQQNSSGAFARSASGVSGSSASSLDGILGQVLTTLVNK